MWIAEAVELMKLRNERHRDRARARVRAVAGCGGGATPEYPILDALDPPETAA